MIAPGLAVLFCGINPGLYSAATGYHFARPGNRFWPALHASGFTPRRLRPSEQGALPRLGLGITNLVERATAGAAELAPDELAAGGRALEAKVLHYSPRFLAVLGVGAFRAAFGEREAKPGPLARKIGRTRLWLLPNPSGLNAHYRPADLAAAFRELRQAAGLPDAAG